MWERVGGFQAESNTHEAVKVQQIPLRMTEMKKARGQVVRTEPGGRSKGQFLMSPDWPSKEFGPDPDGNGKPSEHFVKGIV